MDQQRWSKVLPIAPQAAALFKTLEQALSEDFTPQVRAAWAHVYAVMASVMQEARETTEVR